MSSNWPADMDPECIALCDTLNLMPGIVTSESCCGHGRDKFRIWFDAVSFAALNRIAILCHEGSVGRCIWEVKVTQRDPDFPLLFVLEGAIGTYETANRLAKLFRKSARCLRASGETDVRVSPEHEALLAYDNECRREAEELGIAYSRRRLTKYGHSD